MKQTIRLCTLMLLVATPPLEASLVGGSNPPPGPPPPSQTPAPVSTPTNPAPASHTVPSPSSGTLPANIPQDLSKLSPEQSKQLLQQAKNLNPDQLQAIAKSFQQSQLPPPPSESVPVAKAMILEREPPPAPGQPQKSAAELQRDQAFGMLIDDVLPMSPEQITKIHKYYDKTLQAKATPANSSPTPNIRSERVSIEPGSETPVIRLAAGFVTSINFSDSSGAAWPLTAYSIGDPQTFNIQWDHKSHTIFIQSMKPYAHGNLAVRLWGLDTPVMLTLVSGQKNVDFRVDLQVAGRGPDAKPVIIEAPTAASVNPLLMNILDGVPPRGSIKLHISGGPAEAWKVDNKIYFRTKLTLLSPAWVASVSSPDGTHVYELMLTPSILASQNGKTIDIKLSGL
jgi:intracellular multiplication protein IcmK